MKDLIKILEEIEHIPITRLALKIPGLVEEIENQWVYEKIIPKIPIIEEEVKEILNKIIRCDTCCSANIYFDVLQKVVESLEKYVYEGKIEVSDALWKFIKDFDRIDDLGTREYFFNQIKKYNYFLP